MERRLERNQTLSCLWHANYSCGARSSGDGATSSVNTLPPIPQFGSAAHWKNAAGNEACLVGQQEYSSVRDHVAPRAVPKQVNVVEILANAGRILLLCAPLFQHRRPHSRWTNRIHANR